MERHGVRTLVFSSSATVYGSPETLPITEDAALAATNPYGTTKLMGEQLLRDLEQRPAAVARVVPALLQSRWARTRAGASASTRGGMPNNLMPYVTQVAVGKREYLRVFGDDYDTPDGTGVRDYIHVVDLAEGHVAALRHLLDGGASHTVNLGTGQGSSVLEVVRAFEAASGRQVPYRVLPTATGRRGGVLCRLFAGAAAARLASAPRIA